MLISEGKVLLKPTVLKKQKVETDDLKMQLETADLAGLQ